MRQKWDAGDVFLIPLEDDSYSVGQIILEEKKALNSVVCAFSLDRVDVVSSNVFFDEAKIVAVLFTTPDLLNSGVWEVVGKQQAQQVSKFLDLEKIRECKYVGVKVVGSGNVTKLMSACFGLRAWDLFHKPNYLDSLLLSPDKKPANLVYKFI